LRYSQLASCALVLSAVAAWSDPHRSSKDTDAPDTLPVAPPPSLSAPSIIPQTSPRDAKYTRCVRSHVRCRSRTSIFTRKCPRFSMGELEGPKVAPFRALSVHCWRETLPIAPSMTSLACCRTWAEALLMGMEMKLGCLPRVRDEANVRNLFPQIANTERGPLLKGRLVDAGG
jgi:hypothetical protein